MDRATIAKGVRGFIAENYLLGRDYRFEDSDSFFDHSIIDSIGILQLVTFLQDTYGITVEDEELIPQNLDSIDAVSAFLCRKLDGNDSPQDAQESQGGQFPGLTEKPSGKNRSAYPHGVAVAGDSPAPQGAPAERA
jgi:acyl carrier protein